MVVRDCIEFVDNGPLESLGRIKNSLGLLDLLDESTLSMHCCSNSLFERVAEHLDVISGGSRGVSCLLFLLHHLILLIFLRDHLLILPYQLAFK